MILVTGSSGFIGRNFVTELISRRCEYRTASRNFLESKTDNIVVGDINANTDWSNALVDVNCIIHLAGAAHDAKVSDDLFNETNHLGTLNLARYASKSGVKRFVFVSSIGVNGTKTGAVPFSPYQDLNPHNSYAESKYRAEVGLKRIERETGLEVVIVRPTLVYGPRAPGNFGKLTSLICKTCILPFGSADNKRSFIAVQNVVDLLFVCANHPNAAGHAFLASDGEAISIKDFTNAIGEGLDKKIVQLAVPVSLIKLLGKVLGKSAMIEQLYGDLQVDSSNLKTVLGWTPPLSMKQAMLSLRHSSK